MQEERYFLVPGAGEQNELPPEEAAHALKSLRLKEGDEVCLIDGRGKFHRARLTVAQHKCCQYEIIETSEQPKGWEGTIHLAIAPTKNSDRTEWMAEKCTEIGIDELSFIDCKNSERHHIRTERIEKVVASAVKQSRKPYVPKVNDMADFDAFLQRESAGKGFICHCYEDMERTELPDELAALDPQESVTILVGPEGDFTKDEVQAAVERGYKPVALGTFRLRTETAGVMAVSMYSLAKRIKKPI